ncbi:uncharacterized protein LOC134266745, partial [Saccostrea cucullata]|uniref:uncharacterized protein LOC134266745 n=1 Tax=Saccostrea cuccullata TaxID=36930 RepID=UPI002ED30A29
LHPPVAPCHGREITQTPVKLYTYSILCTLKQTHLILYYLLILIWCLSILTRKEIDSSTKKQQRRESNAKDETDFQGEFEDPHCSSDFRNVYSYDTVKENILDAFKSIKTLVNQKRFQKYVQTDCFGLDNINKKFEWREKDLMKTDCAIVVAGETSSGKSSVINLIIGKEILPIDIMATTTRVCRIKYSDRMRVSTLNKMGEELSNSEFDDEEKLIEMMEELATTDDHQIEYIDVWFPLPILKGNIIIVDTPGKGDAEQNDVAKKMMEYIPNALAFIFVVNVASAGGFQDDRLLHIIKRIRESMNQMYCFDPEDAIFLLNKWDAVVDKRRTRRRDTYMELKDKVHTIWKEAKDRNILKFASAKVQEQEVFKTEFDKFHELLKEVISKNEFKRVKVHLGFIESFLNECDISLLSKIRFANQSKAKTWCELDQIDRELQFLKDKRQEASSNLHKSITKFFEETAEDLHQYIHSSEFYAIVFPGIDKYMRFNMGRELDTRIEKATLSWQQQNIGKLFKKKIFEKLTDNFCNLHKRFHRLKDRIRGFTSPFNIDEKFGPVLLSLVAPNGTAFLGNLAMLYMSVDPNVAAAVTVTGVIGSIVLTGLVAMDVHDAAENVAKNAYYARINKITKEKIKVKLRTTYAEQFVRVVREYLDGDLKNEIDVLEETMKSTRSKIDSFRTKVEVLLSISSEFSKIRQRLEDLTEVEIKLD